MKKSVIEYFDTYFNNLGGELNESTTNDQIEQAALELINLTEEVLLFVEKILPSMRSARSKVKQAAATQVASKHLKKPFLNLPLTPNQRLRNRNRKIAMQTSRGKNILKHLDSGGLKKDKKAAEVALRSSPGAASPQQTQVATDIKTKKPIYDTKPSVAQDALARGKEIGKENLKKLGSAGRDVHRDVKGHDAPMPSGIKGVKSQDPSKKSIDWKKHLKRAAIGAGIGLGAAGLGVGVLHLQKESANNGEEEHKKGFDSGESGENRRVAFHLKNMTNKTTFDDALRDERKRRRVGRGLEQKELENLVTKIKDQAVEQQPHRQKSLVVGGKNLGKPITTKGGKEVAAETKRAKMSAGSLMDIINQHPHLKRRFEMGGTRKEREARGGQRKLFK